MQGSKRCDPMASKESKIIAGFKQAVQWIREGKKVRRAGYPEKAYISNYYKSGAICGIESGYMRIKPEKIEDFEATDWEIYEEGYYECHNCNGELEKSDMGKRCKHCRDWTYHYLDFKKGKKPEKVESLSDFIVTAGSQRKINSVINTAHIRENIKLILEDLNEANFNSVVIDKIFKNRLGDKLI